MARSRVAPLKQLSISKLELMAALLGARLADYICDNLDLDLSSATFWTDAKDVLYWIHSNGVVWKRFISNRVQEIQRLASPLQWRHVPGVLNPADLPSRGVYIDQLQDGWWCGLDWLKEDAKLWPVQPDIVPSDVVEQERKKRVATILVCSSTSVLKPVCDINRFSSLSRLLRVTVYAMRFVDAFKHRNKQVLFDQLSMKFSELCIIGVGLFSNLNMKRRLVI
ncbi:Uncharacterised protein r2_g4049 [Pycnogonum litorale]